MKNETLYYTPPTPQNQYLRQKSQRNFTESAMSTTTNDPASPQAQR